jgi:hypothetical protein
VAVGGRQAQHGVLPQPHPQPVDQGLDRVLRIFGAVQPGLPRAQRLGAGDRQGNRVKAEAGVDGIGQALDPLAQQAHHQRRIAGGLAGFHRQHAPRAVAAMQGHGKAPPAQPPLLHLHGHLPQEILGHVEHIVGPRDRFGKARFRRDRRFGHAGASGAATSPVIWRRRSTTLSPKRAARAEAGRVTRSPTRLSPARRRAVVACSPRSSAATGRAATSSARRWAGCRGALGRAPQQDCRPAHAAWKAPQFLPLAPPSWLPIRRDARSR